MHVLLCQIFPFEIKTYSTQVPSSVVEGPNEPLQVMVVQRCGTHILRTWVQKASAHILISGDKGVCLQTKQCFMIYLI